MVEDYQKYPIKGLDSKEDADLIVSKLEESGYYQCMADDKNSLLIIPIAHAGYINDIEEILLGIGFEIED